MIGRTYGLLTINDIDGRFFICKCSGCSINDYRRRKDAFFSKSQNVYSCGCKQNQPQKEARYNWSGYKDLTGHQFSRWRTGAKNRNLSFNITPEFVWHMYEQQDRKCPITGEYLFFYEKAGGKTNISIDRKDNSIGYEENNVWLTHIDFNKFHHTYSIERVVELSKLIIHPIEAKDNSIESMPSWFYQSAKRGANLGARNYEFSITRNDILNQFNKQLGCCYYTGLPITISKLAKDRKIQTSASLDRMDNTVGYTIDNIILCQKEINMMKKDLSYDRFKFIASCMDSH
jgi:hypothetical protein